MRFPRFVQHMVGGLARMVFDRSLENPAISLADWRGWGDYNPTTAGVNVNEWSALSSMPVLAAVQVISGDLSSLPLPLYKRLPDGGRERAVAHPVYKLLRNPNPEMGSMTFRGTLQAHVLTWGNGYAEIEKNQSGRPVALWPLTPDRVTPDRNSAGRLIYRVRNRENIDRILTADRIFHVAGLAFDGLIGYSPVRLMREAIGLGMATEKFGSAFFGNGAWAGVVLEYPEILGADQHARLKQSWNDIHQGAAKGHGVTILEKGMKVSKPLTFPPDDAQFLQTRGFQVIEVARGFNIAVHKLREMGDQHYNNIEHEGISHVTDTLRPWGVRWEQEIDRKLLNDSEREEFYSEHLFDGLLRGDMPSRYAAHAVARQWGWRSVNEIKRIENENPIGPDGDIYLVPMNMVPADQPTPAPEPAPPAAKPEQEQAAMPEPGPKRALVAAQRAIFVEAIGRLLRKEAAAARRMAGRGGDALRVWVDEFYIKHRLQLAEAIQPAIRAHLVACGDGIGAEARADAVAAEHVGRSVQELLEVIDTKPKVSELEGTIDRLVSRWEIARPAEMADIVFAEENGR